MRNFPVKALLLLFLLFMVKTAAFAAPQNTLPPGFHSTPLEQPDVIDEPPPKDGDFEGGIPLGTPLGEGIPPIAVDKALLLLDQALLLPNLTGLLYGLSGLGADIWLGSEDEVLQELLKNWQVVPRTRPAAQLARKFLLTQAHPPSALDKYSFVNMRLEKLYALGDLPSIERFFNAYPVLTSRAEFDLIYQKFIFAKWAGTARAVRDGCALWRAARRDETSINDDALQIEALCLAILGQSGLGLSKAEKLSDSGQAPREFFPLLVYALGNVDTRVDRSVAVPSEINSLLWALYKASAKNPRSLKIKNIEAALLPIMAKDRSLPHGWRLSITQAGILRDIIPPRNLQIFYQTRNSAVDNFEAPLKFKRTVQENRTEIARISNILSNAPTRAAYIASLYAWGRDIAHESIGYRRVDALAASLLFNKAENVKTWFKKTDDDQPLVIKAMFAIMQYKSNLGQRGVSPQVIERWRETMETLINIAGAEFFDQSTSGLPSADDTREGDDIIEAAEDNKRTEVLLRVLSGLDNPTLARNPSFLRAVVQGLSMIGLKQDAWRIMMDSFLIESWGA